MRGALPPFDYKFPKKTDNPPLADGHSTRLKGSVYWAVVKAASC
jgi:hypothetical protein